MGKPRGSCFDVPNWQPGKTSLAKSESQLLIAIYSAAKVSFLFLPEYIAFYDESATRLHPRYHCPKLLTVIVA